MSIFRSWVTSLCGFFLLAGSSQAHCTTCGCYELSAEYLYWQPTQSGMSYALGLEGAELTISTSEDFHQKFKWGSGFRLGIGYDFPCDSYGLSFSWTRFHNHVTGSDFAPVIIATELLSPFLSTFLIGGNNGGVASTRWSLHFDMLDLEFGTPFNLPCVSFYPYIGLKGGWITQNQKINYDNFEDSVGGRLNAQIVENNKFYGAGPKFGIMSHYYLCGNFSFFGNVAAALLYGHDHNPVQTFIAPVGSAAFNLDYEHAQNRLLPTTQMQLGINWASCFCECYFVSLALSYELQHFWSVWRDYNSGIQTFYIADAGYGDLMFQGVTAQVAVRF